MPGAWSTGDDTAHHAQGHTGRDAVAGGAAGLAGGQAVEDHELNKAMRDTNLGSTMGASGNTMGPNTTLGSGVGSGLGQHDTTLGGQTAHHGDHR